MLSLIRSFYYSKNRLTLHIPFNIPDLKLDLILVLSLSRKYLSYSVKKVKKVFKVKKSVGQLTLLFAV